MNKPVVAAFALFCLPVLAQPTLEPLKTSITVTAEIEAGAPANLTVMDQQELEATPGVNLDDRLRIVPGFSLFRRSSSLVAHPTTQGVSLRGIAPTGASRTLIRWDGVPVNDPFGGWVQWTRFPPEEIDRVELSRGASTSVFGDRAMGGVLSLFSRPVDRNRVHAGYEIGNRNTHQASAGFARLWPRFAASASARGFTTNGYFIVPEEERGAIDREASVRFVSGLGRLDYLGSSNRFFLKFDLLAEERGNGTEAQRNSTSLGTISGHYFRETSRNGFSLLGYHTREEFRSTFSAIAPDRNSERATSYQSVPAEATGGAGAWRHSRSAWRSLVGADFHHVEGHSRDKNFFTGAKTAAGGTLLQHGYYGQFDLDAGPARIFLGARGHFADGGRRFFSPSAGVAGGRGILRLRASAYRSFRVPTLNELYRPFRVGNVITQPNDELGPESVTGVEAGFDLAGERTRLSVTAYRNELEDIITNVTLSVAPALIVRQRRNAEEALARGFEVEARHRLRRWLAEVSYLFVDSRFVNGSRVPQVARHQGSAQLTWSGGSTLFSFGVRAYSFQFEDDLNEFLLPGFAVLHFTFERRLTRHLDAMVSVENLLSREFLVGFTPTPTVGNPRLWRAGLRWRI